MLSADQRLSDMLLLYDMSDEDSHCTPTFERSVENTY